MRQLPKTKVLILAMGLGLVAALLAYVYLARMGNVQKTMVSIVAAKKPIPTGAILEPEMLTVRSLPRNVLPDGCTTDTEMLVGKIAVRPIREGEPISRSYVAEKSRLSHMVPPFMRAVTIGIDPVVGVGGFLKPGDKVDVLATFESNGGAATRTVLQNVELIAIGPSSETGTKISAANSKTLSTATLSLLPAEAEKLVLADTRGQLRLVLRRSDDPSYTSTKGVNSKSVIGVIPPDEPEKKPNTPPAQTVQAQPPASVSITKTAPPAAAPKAVIAKPKVKPRPAQVTKPAKPVKPPVKTIEIIRGTEVESTVVDE